MILPTPRPIALAMSSKSIDRERPVESCPRTEQLLGNFRQAAKISLFGWMHSFCIHLLKKHFYLFRVLCSLSVCSSASVGTPKGIKGRCSQLVCSSSIRSDEGLTLERSASESLYGGQFTLSTRLIKPNYPLKWVLT